MLSTLRLARAAAGLASTTSAAAALASSSAASIGRPALHAAAASAAASTSASASGRPFAVSGLRWASAESGPTRASTSGAGLSKDAQASIGTAAAASAAFAAALPSTSLPGGRRPPSALPPHRPRRPAGGPPPPPWAPTADLPKRKFLPRRMAHLMQVLEKEREEASLSARPLPDFRPGDALEVKLAIAENRGRPATLRGVCIARRSAGWRSSLTLLSHIPGGGVVTRAVPLHSPALQELRVVERARVKARRAKLYYLGKRNPREWRI